MIKKSLLSIVLILILSLSATIFADPSAPAGPGSPEQEGPPAPGSPEQEGPPAPTQTQQQIQDQTECNELTSTLLKSYLEEFYGQVTEFMRSPSATSSNLIELQTSFLNYQSSMQQLTSNKLSDYKEDVRSILDRGNLESCNTLIENSMKEMQEVFVRAVEKSSSKKSALMIVGKLDSINLKLSDLVSDINYLADQLSALDSKLPCYTKKCIR